MPLDTKTLCGYRLKRAVEDLLTAEYNHRSGFYKASINRSYYAIFHSIWAVNILDGFDASVQLKNAKVFFDTVKTYLQKRECDQKLQIG